MYWSYDRLVTFCTKCNKKSLSLKISIINWLISIKNITLGLKSHYSLRALTCQKCCTIKWVTPYMYTLTERISQCYKSWEPLFKRGKFFGFCSLDRNCVKNYAIVLLNNFLHCLWFTKTSTICGDQILMGRNFSCKFQKQILQ